MSAPRPEILFVHGLWMHGCVFTLHRRRLREMGWRSHAYSYPSLRGSLAGAADGLAAFIAGLDGRPLLFDAIEFNPRLRWIDTACDIAFLFMDLHAHGLAPLAWRFLNAWLEQTGDYGAL